LCKIEDNAEGSSGHLAFCYTESSVDNISTVYYSRCL